MILGPHTVTLLRGTPGEDDYGNAGVDFTNPARTDVDGCSVQPAGSDEYVVDRESVTVRYRAYLPNDPDVQSTDRAEFKGVQFDIDGVERWDFPQLAHTVLILRSVEG